MTDRMLAVTIPLLAVLSGCDPPQTLKTYQILPQTQECAGVGIQSLEVGTGTRIEYRSPVVIITGPGGTSWSIYLEGNKPTDWMIFRQDDGQEPTRVPLETLDVKVKRIM
jgi:hypothetical protein